MIFQTNMATSYAAGRWAQINDPDLADFRPYIKYHHADGVLHPRPWHVAWNGLVLPKDHLFWQTNAPPNGWGCHCYVSAAGPKDTALIYVFDAPEGIGKVAVRVNYTSKVRIDGQRNKLASNFVRTGGMLAPDNVVTETARYVELKR